MAKRRNQESAAPRAAESALSTSDLETFLRLAQKASTNEELQLIAKLARQSLVAPPANTELAPVSHARSDAAPVNKAPLSKKNWKKVPHTCPKCGKQGHVDPDFGVRVVRGIERLQSWCHDCRATTNYYSAPRKKKV